MESSRRIYDLHAEGVLSIWDLHPDCAAAIHCPQSLVYQASSMPCMLLTVIYSHAYEAREPHIHILGV